MLQQQTLRKSWELIQAFAFSSLKEQTANSYLGYFWYILHPLLLFGMVYFIFTPSFGSTIPSYGLYVLLGVTIWTFFQRATAENISAFRSYRGTIKAFRFPLETIIFGNILKVLIMHLCFLVILIPIMAMFNANPLSLLTYLIILPWYILFVAGISFFLSIIGIYIEDVINVWQFFIVLYWFFTPIFYELPSQGLHYGLSLYSPLYYFVAIPRDVILSSSMPSLSVWLILIIVSLTSFISGLLLFTLMKRKIAERV